MENSTNTMISQIKSCALVLGGGLNGYSVVRELYDHGMQNIILFAEDVNESARHSNMILESHIAAAERDGLRNNISELHKKYEKIIVYATTDTYISAFLDMDGVPAYCDVGFNVEKIHNLITKQDQYRFCENNAIDYPKTDTVENYLKSDKTHIRYPVLIKPDVWDEKTLLEGIPKTLVLETQDDLQAHLPRLKEILAQGINMLISEVIPGDDSQIYIYVAYRSKDGQCLGEWIGRKLTQHPEGYGVFSTISNQAPDEILPIGRRIFEKMELWGINDVELKFDARDQKYKYIETNYRTSMFHRLGHLSGVDLCYIRYLDSCGMISPKQIQNRDINIHFVSFKNELFNLLARPGYITKLCYNIFHSDKTYFSLWNLHDPKPFLSDVKIVLRGGVSHLLKKILGK